jgi:hypothetical protein
MNENIVEDITHLFQSKYFILNTFWVLHIYYIPTYAQISNVNVY